MSVVSLALCGCVSVSWFQDIPVHNTPQKSRSSLVTPTKPLSTSDPSYYGNEATPGLMNTPVEMILNSELRMGRGVFYQALVMCVELMVLFSEKMAKLPVLVQLQQQVHGVPGSGGSGIPIHGSGRSPFVSRLQTPNTEAAKFLKV